MNFFYVLVVILMFTGCVQKQADNKSVKFQNIRIENSKIKGWVKFFGNPNKYNYYQVLIEGDTTLDNNGTDKSRSYEFFWPSTYGICNKSDSEKTDCEVGGFSYNTPLSYFRIGSEIKRIRLVAYYYESTFPRSNLKNMNCNVVFSDWLIIEKEKGKTLY